MRTVKVPLGDRSYSIRIGRNLLSRLGAECQRLELGMLWINQPAAPFPELPFGGVKDSGYGSEGGPEALESYLVTKTVSIMAA